MQTMQTKTSLQQLCDIGQSVWLDTISRQLLESGKLKNLIDQGVMGVTSNPAIFDQAISKSIDYDAAIKQLCLLGLSISEIYDELTAGDIRQAADFFLPMYESTRGRDGYVSLEVNPLLAANTAETIQEAKRLHEKVGRPNLMIKVPATDAGFDAITTLLSQGINVNATLIFSQRQYLRTMEAFLKSAEEFRKSGGDLSRLASVASVFVSRIDTTVDALLDETIQKTADTTEAQILRNLKGKAAVANSQLIFRLYHEFFSQERFLQLQKKGLRKQRLLWASTSAKNPSYSDIKYITELIAPDTVNTMPQITLQAFLDHGNAQNALTIETQEAEEILAILSKKGIVINQICEKLLAEGVIAFENSFESLIAAITKKAK